MTSLLSQPLKIGSFTAPNRILQAAHSKQYSNRLESERETAYYVRRAQGGCGLFVAGNHFVHESGSIRGFQDAFRPESVAANRAMTDAVHAAGARMLVQLNHHGAQAAPQSLDGPRPIYAPIRMISPSTGLATREMTHGDIRMFVEAWAESARLAREGGFDGVEIHMAHGYLLHQFFTPLYNTRTDAYGGDLEGRTRFAREVLTAVRREVGDDFTVGIRICLNEHNEAGLDAADFREIIARLRAETRIDFIDTAAGGYHDVHWVFPSSAMPVAWLREDVAALKAANPDVPVFGVGSALRVEEAEEVLASGIADMVALTRGQLADPDLARKLQTGETGTIRHCIRVTPFETLLPHVGAGYERQVVLRTLAAGRFARTTNAAVRADAGGLVVRDLLTDEERAVPASAVVPLTPRAAVGVDGLDAEGLEAALGVPVTAIGDALSPRNIDAAIFEAHHLARRA